MLSSSKSGYQLSATTLLQDRPMIGKRPTVNDPDFLDETNELNTPTIKAYSSLIDSKPSEVNLDGLMFSKEEQNRKKSKSLSKFRDVQKSKQSSIQHNIEDEMDAMNVEDSEAKGKMTNELRNMAGSLNTNSLVYKNVKTEFKIQAKVEKAC